MAKITQEKIELINELYAEIGVKSRVAKEVGCSPSTVSKYIIEGYVPKAKRVQITCDAKPTGCDEFLKELCAAPDFFNGFRSLTKLTDIEKNGLNELKKEIF